MLRGFSGFREMLAARQKAVNSLVCVGLDPLPEKLPPHLSKLWKLNVDNSHLATATSIT